MLPSPCCSTGARPIFLQRGVLMYRQQLFPSWDLIEVLAMHKNVNSDELENVSWGPGICVTVN